MYRPIYRLCIKVGRRQGDGDIGTRVWGLGTWDLGLGTWDLGLGTWGCETRDFGTSSMGRGTSKPGTQGTRDVKNYCKSRR